MKSTCQPTTQDYSNLIGVPYEKMNCWDITKAFYENVLGIELKHIFEGPTPQKETTRALIYSNMGDFEKAETPEFGDIIIIKLRNIESHIAVYLGFDKMLHTTNSTGSCIDRITRWKPMIIGFYRIKRK